MDAGKPPGPDRVGSRQPPAGGQVQLDGPGTCLQLRRLEQRRGNGVDDEPVELVVLLAVNDADKTGVHVKLLSGMARKLASAETCKRLLDAKTAEKLIQIFSE